MLPALRQPAPRLALNFIRRHKWAFRPEYERLRPQVAPLDLSAFADASMEVLKDKQVPLRLHFGQARDGLAELNSSPVGAAGPWHEDRLQVRVADSSLAQLFAYIFLQGFSISLCRCRGACPCYSSYNRGCDRLQRYEA